MARHIHIYMTTDRKAKRKTKDESSEYRMWKQYVPRSPQSIRSKMTTLLHNAETAEAEGGSPSHFYQEMERLSAPFQEDSKPKDSSLGTAGNTGLASMKTASGLPSKRMERQTKATEYYKKLLERGKK